MLSQWSQCPLGDCLGFPFAFVVWSFLRPKAKWTNLDQLKALCSAQFFSTSSMARSACMPPSSHMAKGGEFTGLSNLFVAPLDGQ